MIYKFGRLDVLAPPLSFSEFLGFRGHEALGMEEIEKLNAEFIDYINFGGFPEAVMDEAAPRDVNRRLMVLAEPDFGLGRD